MLESIERISAFEPVDTAFSVVGDLYSGGVEEYDEAGAFFERSGAGFSVVEHGIKDKRESNIQQKGTG